MIALFRPVHNFLINHTKLQLLTPYIHNFHNHKKINISLYVLTADWEITQRLTFFVSETFLFEFLNGERSKNLLAGLQHTAFVYAFSNQLLRV